MRATALIAILAMACGETKRRDYLVTSTFPHDTGAYTQGLLYHAGALYESTGEYGRSTLRRVDLTTGRPSASVALPTSRLVKASRCSVTACINSRGRATWVMSTT